MSGKLLQLRNLKNNELKKLLTEFEDSSNNLYLEISSDGSMFEEDNLRMIKRQAEHKLINYLLKQKIGGF